jgi:hypothetical protein
MANVMHLPRRVEPEMLDLLPAEDPRAIRSRQDLRRINRAMATRSILGRGIDAATRGVPPRRIVELGAGDGSLLLWLARRRAEKWPGVEATVVDRQNLIAPETRRGFATHGWKLRVIACDVFDWIDETDATPYDLALTNLFLHHFPGDALARLLPRIAARTSAFVACEPRRAATALFGSHLIGLLGCNAISRNDAVLSVHAGFRDAELSAAWPGAHSWKIDEYPAGLFSHCFVATKERQVMEHGSR